MAQAPWIWIQESSLPHPARSVLPDWRGLRNSGIEDRQARGGPGQVRSLPIVAALVAGVASTSANAELISCEQVHRQWQQTTGDTPFEEWAAVYEQAFNDSDCDGEVVAQIGLDILRVELEPIQMAYDADGSGVALPGLLNRLDRLQEYGSHWQLSFLRGEIYRKLRNPARALTAYRDALALVDDEELTVIPPPIEEIALLRDRLDEVVVIVAQIDPAAIRLPVTRNGELISQYSFATRGLKRRKSLVPILFEFAKDTMTHVGRGTFRDALETLERQGSPDITVVGHTDPIGSAEYNMGLSAMRAAAVKRELWEQNYGGDVKTVGMGEKLPLLFDPPELYSEELRHQAHRRVELVLQ